MEKDTKTQLLDAAEAVARMRGFDGFSYADLADRVGIRKASIHHHFSTKALLADAMMARYHKIVETELLRIESDHTTAAGRIGGLIDFYRTATGDGRQLCLCVAFSASQNSLPESVDERMYTFREMVTGWLETVFALAVKDKSVQNLTDPGLEAPALLALLEGAQLATRAHQDLSPFDAATALMRARLR